MCLPFGIRYSLRLADLGRDEHLALALGVLAEETMPSISAMMAWSFGLRASKSSATRGRPPVMSLVFVVSRGILAMTSPASIVSPSFDDDVRADRAGSNAPRGSTLGILTVLPCSSLSEMRGRELGVLATR